MVGAEGVETKGAAVGSPSTQIRGCGYLRCFCEAAEFKREGNNEAHHYGSRTCDSPCSVGRFGCQRIRVQRRRPSRRLCGRWRVCRGTRWCTRRNSWTQRHSLPRSRSLHQALLCISEILTRRRPACLGCLDHGHLAAIVSAEADGAVVHRTAPPHRGWPRCHINGCFGTCEGRVGQDKSAMPFAPTPRVPRLAVNIFPRPSIFVLLDPVSGLVHAQNLIACAIIQPTIDGLDKARGSCIPVAYELSER